jgi:hypothetical protein
MHQIPLLRALIFAAAISAPFVRFHPLHCSDFMQRTLCGAPEAVSIF